MPLVEHGLSGVLLNGKKGGVARVSLPSTEARRSGVFNPDVKEVGAGRFQRALEYRVILATLATVAGQASSSLKGYR